MFSALTITSTKQGLGYDETASIRAFAVVEKLADFARALMQAARGVKFGVATLRPARA